MHRLKNLIPPLLGITAFLIIAGPRILYPLNIAWLGEGELLQHYLGWAFFRNSPWTFPVGLNPKYGMEFSNAIVFTDSIPLFAIFFKFFNEILPVRFQYFGIWILMCFILQAWFASKLLELITDQIVLQSLGTILFLFAPPMIFRMGYHNALMGHFLILAALFLSLRKKQQFQSLYWAILLSISILCHFYLFVIVFALFLANFMTRIFLIKTLELQSASIYAIVLACLLWLIFWQAGYLSIKGALASASGFGDFRTNLLALLNSRTWSYWLRPINLYDPVELAVGEGFQFLGAGVILLWICAIPVLYKSKDLIWSAVKTQPFLLIVLSILALLSFSNNIGIGAWNIKFSIPQYLIDYFSLVRSSARLFWPIFYLFIFLAVFFVIRGYSRKIATSIFLIAVSVQIIDTSAGWLRIRQKLNSTFSSQLSSPLKDPFWAMAGKRYKNVVMVENPTNWGVFGVFAAQYGMATNMVHLARKDDKKQAENLARMNLELLQLSSNTESLYIFRDWKDSPRQVHFDPKTDLLARIDGFNVLAPDWKSCKECGSLNQSLEIQNLAPFLKLDQTIIFSSKGDGRENYMLEGWGYTEGWGTWATDAKAKLIFPIPQGRPKAIEFEANAFLSSGHPELDLEVLGNGISLGKVTLTRSTKNTFIISLPKNLSAGNTLSLEIRSVNAVSPKSQGIGDDVRQLGIGLVTMRFIK